MMHPDFGPSQWANHLRDSCQSFWEHQIEIFPSFMRCPRNTTELLLNRQRNNPRNINREQIKPLLLYGHVVKVPYELSNLLRYSWKMHRFRAEPLPRCPKKKAWPSSNPSRVGGASIVYQSAYQDHQDHQDHILLQQHQSFVVRISCQDIAVD